MDTPTLILAAFIVTAAAFIRAITGFGYALIATPLLTLVFEPKSVVVMTVILSSSTHLIVLLQMRQHVDVRRLGFISLGSIFGIPLGAYLLSTLEPSVVKLAIAIAVVPFSILLLLGHSHHFRRDRLGCIIAGFISGVLQASTSLGGPPVILFLLNQGITKERFVGTMAAFALLMTIASMGAYSTLGLINTSLLVRVALLLPALFLGTFIGIKVLPKVKTALFRKLVPSVVCATALAIIVPMLIKL